MVHFTSGLSSSHTRTARHTAAITIGLVLLTKPPTNTASRRMIECVMEVPPEFHLLDYSVSAGWCMENLTSTKMESIDNL